MSDGGIGDEQLSASSVWDDTHTVLKARPFHEGWCAAYRDNAPYFQVIDGILKLYCAKL